MTFVSKKYGEFVYQLECTVEDPTPILVPEISCPLGLKASKVITLQNPLKSNQIVSVAYPPNLHFDVTAPKSSNIASTADNEFKMELLAAQEGSITVTFRPSKVAIHAPCIIKIGNRLIGWKSYKVQGRGTDPHLAMETHQKSKVQI